jgi:hypothetical protein
LRCRSRCEADLAVFIVSFISSSNGYMPCTVCGRTFVCVRMCVCVWRGNTSVYTLMCSGWFLYSLFVWGRVNSENLKKTNRSWLDIGGIVDYHCLNFLLICWYWRNCWLSLFKLSFSFFSYWRNCWLSLFILSFVLSISTNQKKV